MVPRSAVRGLEIVSGDSAISYGLEVVPMTSLEARHNAQMLEAYRLRIIQERWLSTLILTVHLEIGDLD